MCDGFLNIDNGLLSRNKSSTTWFYCAYKKMKRIFRLVIIKNDNQQQYDKKANNTTYPFIGTP
jgi:hypothetical protein